jgi:hypothetical protein
MNTRIYGRELIFVTMGTAYCSKTQPYLNMSTIAVDR